MKLCVHLWQYLSDFFFFWNAKFLDKSCREKQNIHFLFNNSPPPPQNRAIYKVTWKSMVEPDRLQVAVQCMHFACWVPKATDTHTHTICNTYCSSTKATVVMQTLLNVSFVHTLPVLLAYVLWAFRQLSVYHLTRGHWPVPSTSFACYYTLNIRLFTAARYAQWQTHWSNVSGCNNYNDIRWRERTNKMQLIWCLLSNFLSQHVSGIIMPIIRRIRPCPTACGVLPGCVGCGWLRSCGAAS